MTTLHKTKQFANYPLLTLPEPKGANSSVDNLLSITAAAASTGLFAPSFLRAHRPRTPQLPCWLVCLARTDRKQTNTETPVPAAVGGVPPVAKRRAAVGRKAVPRAATEHAVGVVLSRYNRIYDTIGAPAIRLHVPTVLTPLPDISSHIV